MLFGTQEVRMSVWGTTLLNMYETVYYNAADDWMNNWML